jgi:hypothetical protein
MGTVTLILLLRLEASIQEENARSPELTHATYTPIRTLPIGNPLPLAPGFSAPIHSRGLCAACLPDHDTVHGRVTGWETQGFTL